MDELIRKRDYEAMQTNAVPTGFREPNIRERIELAVEKAKSQLADAQRMQELFDKNPDLEELVNLMNKGRI